MAKHFHYPVLLENSHAEPGPGTNNMIFPGPDIGGYCLPKDGGLGVWSYNALMGFEDDIFKITPMAIDINDTRIQQDRAEALKDADCMILAVRHDAYMDLDPEQMVALSGKPMAVIDCFGILSDAKIQHYFELGCEIKGLARGHIKRIKDRVQKKKPNTQHPTPKTQYPTWPTGL